VRRSLRKFAELRKAGDVLNFIEIFDVNFREFGARRRHLGELLAKWCNESRLEKPLLGRNKSARWKYIDFYMTSYASAVDSGLR
jgi:hypothetical protein